MVTNPTVGNSAIDLHGPDRASRERVREAMALGHPRRVPVMCQLAIGHYFLNSGLAPVDIWTQSDAFAEALVRLQRNYRLDGILVNLPGRDPAASQMMRSVGESGGNTAIDWSNRLKTIVPPDDCPRVVRPDGTEGHPDFSQVEPGQLHYVDPWNLGGVSYPFKWDFDEEPRPLDNFFPEWHGDIIRGVKSRVGDTVSVHAEVFSPFSQLVELLGCQQALLALVLDTDKVLACLERLSVGAAELACKQAALGVDAVLISSAYAGAGFISRETYQEMVLPFERRVIGILRNSYPEIPVYTHTCGAIGDRLDLMLETGTLGIDTLDPPPLGTIELREAAAFLRGKAFIKGNLDAVNTLLNGTREQVRSAVGERLAVAREQGGFILSSACSVAPRTPPDTIAMLAELADENAE